MGSRQKLQYQDMRTYNGPIRAAQCRVLCVVVGGLLQVLQLLEKRSSPEFGMGQSCIWEMQHLT